MTRTATDRNQVLGPKLARELGVTMRQVQRLAREGVVVKAGRGRYDFEKSVENYRSLTAPVADLDYAEAKRRRAVADAGLAEFRLAQKRGEMVSVDAVEAMAHRAGVIARQTMTTEMRKVAPKLAGMDDAAAIARLLDATGRVILRAEAEALREFAGASEDA